MKTKPKPINPEAVLTLIQQCVGKQSAMRATDMVRALTNQAPTGALTRRLREQIMALRDSGWPICAHPVYGYWWPASPDELEAVCNFHWQRAISSLRQISRQRRLGKPALAGQLNLPTLEGLTIPTMQTEDKTSDITVVSEIPEELHESSQEYLKANPRVDWNALVITAIQQFLRTYQ
jgi:hypothetical protein